MLFRSEPEIVADFGDLNGEAPVWDPTGGRLYWTDCVGHKFSSFDSKTGKGEVLRRGIEVTGFALREGGGFVIANTKGLWIWDGADDLQLLAAEVEGQRCQMNDAAADPQGRFLAGSCFYDPAGGYRLGCLMQVDTGGRARVLDDGIHLANGLGFSSNGSQLYFTDSAARTIFRYDYNLQTGRAQNRSILVRVPLSEGIPDGLAVDAEDHIWSAQWYGGCIVRYDPSGKVERRIPIPAHQTSSLAFGGAQLNELFVTSAGEYFPSPLSPKSEKPPGFIGGPLYRLRMEILGKPQFRARIRPIFGKGPQVR